MNVSSFISETTAYKVFTSDIKKGTLSHAYLIVCEDELMLEEYLKSFVKTLLCEKTPYCDDCRICRLIDKKTFVDVKFYPTETKINVKDVDNLIYETYVKPLESDKKIFVLVNAQEMNVQSQNKLLKTLEEPPAGTCIILGATSVYSLLPTVMSRVKRLDITAFDEKFLYNEMSKQLSGEDKIRSAVALSGGKLGEALARYESDENSETELLCYDILTKIKSSKDAYLFCNKITKENVKDVTSYLQRIVRDALYIQNGRAVNGDVDKIKRTEEIAKTLSSGALIYMSNKLTAIEKTVNFNANLSAVTDGILFGVLEGKHKWQK